MSGKDNGKVKATPPGLIVLGRKLHLRAAFGPILFTLQMLADTLSNDDA